MNFDDIVLQHSTRGMDVLFENHPETYIENATKALLGLEKGTVFLYTGFYVGGYAETDGPIGTYFMSQALTKLGYRPIIVTDALCEGYFKECETLYLANEQCHDEFTCKEILKEYDPVCHFSIERCGKNSEGMYANARKKDIGLHTVALDDLYLLGSKSRPSLGIGDGGNEIGMGNFKETILEHLPLSPCVVECDYPVIASVSNWGAYGVIACLQKLTGETLLPEFSEIDAYLDHILSLGSVDGIHVANVKSVDGKEWHTEEEILNALKDAAKN